MNLDLLIKLAKLANNNPNEHEANSAARRACKLIAEGDYKFTETKIAADKFTGGWSAVDDYIRRKSPPPPPNRNPFREGSWSGIDWDDPASSTYKPSGAQKDYYNKSPNTGNSPPKPKTKRECSECGKESSTTNTDLYYVCATCQWVKYGGNKP